MIRSLIVLIVSSVSSHLFSGILLQGGLEYRNFSSKKSSSESLVSNYYGLGPKVVLGYNFSNFLDIGLRTSYIPSSTSANELLIEDISLLTYGLSIGFRPLEVLYVGFGYSLIDLQNYSVHESSEKGSWSGSGPELRFGGAFTTRRNKYKFFQWSLAFGQTEKTSSELTDQEDQTISYVSLNLDYIIVSKSKKGLENLIGGFLDGLF